MSMGSIFTVRELSVVGSEYRSSTRGVYMPTKQRGGLGLNWNIDLPAKMFWDNEIFGRTNEKTFKVVGWHFFLGLRLTDWADISWQHLSVHHLDGKFPHYKRFPAEDAATLKIYFIRPRQ
jgi:hypothetical protein